MKPRTTVKIRTGVTVIVTEAPKGASATKQKQKAGEAEAHVGK